MSAADLYAAESTTAAGGIPVVAEFCWPCLLLAAGIIAGVICAVECHGHHEDIRPVTPGGPQSAYLSFASLTDVFFVAINKVIATFCYGRGGYFLLS